MAGMGDAADWAPAMRTAWSAMSLEGSGRTIAAEVGMAEASPAGGVEDLAQSHLRPTIADQVPKEVVDSERSVEVHRSPPRKHFLGQSCYVVEAAFQ